MEKELLEQEKLMLYKPKEALTVISGGRVLRILFGEIIRISKLGSETRIITSSGEYKTRYSLQELLNDLPVNDYFRVHRSHIISFQRITGITKTRIMLGDTGVPFSDYFRLQMKKRLGELVERGYREMTAPLIRRNL